MEEERYVIGGGGEFETWVESPKRCLDKTLGTATVRKFASEQALGIRCIASHRKKVTTAFWHVRSFQFYLPAGRRRSRRQPVFKFTQWPKISIFPLAEKQ